MVESISKKDIKDAVVEALEPFAKATQSDFKRVGGHLDKIDGRLGGVESRLGGVESRLTNIEFEFSEVKKDVQWMKENSSELFAKLDKFISLYEKQEQEMLIMGAQLKRLEERVAKLESSRKE